MKRATGKVVQLPTVSKFEAKWGLAVAGLNYCMVPSLLCKAQARLGLRPTHFTVVVHLLDHWWDAGRNPYPAKALLAERMRMSPRQVQRCVADLEKRGYIRRQVRTGPRGRNLGNAYDLSGLVAALKQLAPEFAKVEQVVSASRRAVLRPGPRPVATK